MLKPPEQEKLFSAIEDVFCIEESVVEGSL